MPAAVHKTLQTKSSAITIILTKSLSTVSASLNDQFQRNGSSNVNMLNRACKVHNHSKWFLGQLHLVQCQANVFGVEHPCVRFANDCVIILPNGNDHNICIHSLQACINTLDEHTKYTVSLNILLRSHSNLCSAYSSKISHMHNKQYTPQKRRIQVYKEAIKNVT